MREYIKYAFCGREGLRTYLKWSGLGFLVLFIIHMLIIPSLSYVGEPFIVTSPSTAEHYRVFNYYENIGAVFAGIAFAYVLAKIIPVAVNGGTSRVNMVLGTGVIALGYSAVTVLIMNIACLVTSIIYGRFGLKLDINAVAFIEDALRSKAVSDPRVIFFDVCISFYLLLAFYAAAVIFAAVKQKINTAAAFLSSAVSCFLIYLFYRMNASYSGYLSNALDFLLLNRSIGELEYALYPDPRMSDFVDYSDCVISVLSDCFIVFLAAFLVYALLMLRSSLTGRRKT